MKTFTTHGGVLYAFLANETRLAITFHTSSFSGFDSEIFDTIKDFWYDQDL